MDPVQFQVNRCKGCELCVNFCARGCLEMTDALNAIGYKYARIVRPDECTGCSLCADMCPESAIRVFRRVKKAKSNV